MAYVVGDIHGETIKLKSLISQILLEDKNPELVFIGDYIDKGEDAKSTLVFLNQLSQRYKCTFLYGNHEYLWLNFNENDKDTENYLLKYGGKETLRSFEASTISDARKKMLDMFSSLFRSMRYFWKNESYLAVHSGIMPEDYYFNVEDIEGSKLLFNRYEFISNQKMYQDKFKVIFGHTGFYTPYVDEFKIGIDTAACFKKEQPLTAFSTEEKVFINSDGLRYALNYLPAGQCPNIVRQKPWREL